MTDFEGTTDDHIEGNPWEIEDNLTEMLLDADVEVEDIHDFYTEDEINQMAKDAVEIYANDDIRAECWFHAVRAAIENGLKQTRPIGQKLSKAVEIV